MDDKITLLTWVIGLGGTGFAILMGVMWSFILRGQQSLYGYAGKIREELKKEVDMIAIQVREDGKDYENRFARKDEVSEVKAAVNSLRSEMNTSFGAINTHMGGITSQLATIVNVLSSKKNDI